MSGRVGRFAAGSLFWCFVVGGLAGIFVLAAAPRYEQHLVLGAKLAELEADITRLEAEHARHVAELVAVRSDPAYAEEIVRNELRLVRPGEQVFIPGPADEADRPPAPDYRPEAYEPGPLVEALANDERLRVPMFVGAVMAVGTGVFVFGRRRLAR